MISSPEPDPWIGDLHRDDMDAFLDALAKIPPEEPIIPDDFNYQPK